jgi:hypothetical protein
VLAYQEMKVALAAMVNKFSFVLDMDQDDVIASRGLTVSAKNGLWMRVLPRSKVPLEQLEASTKPMHNLSDYDRFNWTRLRR